MTYKGMLLSTLLVPFAIVGNDAADLRIQQLEEKFFQKELELSNLGKMIAERDKLLSSFSLIAHEHISVMLSREVKKAESKNGGNPLPEEEENKLKKELLGSADDFLFSFFATCEKQQDISELLTKGLFQENEILNISEFESLKFHFIQCTFERRVIFDLVKKYEDCIRELLAINAEIENLQKQQ